MLSETAERVRDRSLFEPPLAIGSIRHEALLRENLPDAEILLEPLPRNSAPPIAAACLKNAPDQLLLILPADHHIKNTQAFINAVTSGVDAAQNGQIVTFGIEPDHPATGYGYIEAEGDGAIRPVVRFVEKPDLETAQGYIATRRFFWNAGIFLFRADVMLDALRSHAPDILDAVSQALTEDGLDRAGFRAVRSESIDYAVLEAASNISVAPVSMGWSDLGDYRALHEASTLNGRTDTVHKGAATSTASQNIYVRAEGIHVAVHGLDDVAVVATPEKVLVTRLSDAGGIKPVIKQLADHSQTHISEDQVNWLRDWLWSDVMPGWAERAICPQSKGCVENLNLEGEAQTQENRRGRVAPRQLFSFARAKRLGWNPDQAADQIIENALSFIEGPSRLEQGGWAHQFNADGSIADTRRDLYDHAFIALAGSELAALGDSRGEVLAQEAFATIDTLFADPVHGGWHDPETAPDCKLANPHMHLFEASLAHFEALSDRASLNRINTLCALFEGSIFDPVHGAMAEVFDSNWSPAAESRIEPGHCYEWAYLLGEAERLTGRDTASWRRRLIDFAEQHGVIKGLAVDQITSGAKTYRLWPQLERVRALLHTPRPDKDIDAILNQIIETYLKPGISHGWVDKLDDAQKPISATVPASMVYHLMTALAPLAPPRN